MIKKWFFEKWVELLFGAIALGIGIWYLSSSIGGASLSYTSFDLFMRQIGAENGDVTTTISETAAKLNYIDLIQKLRVLNEKKAKEIEEDGDTGSKDN